MALTQLEMAEQLAADVKHSEAQPIFQSILAAIETVIDGKVTQNQQAHLLQLKSTYGLAMCHYYDEDYIASLMLFNQLLALGSKNDSPLFQARAYIGLGMNHYKMKRYQRAEAYETNAIDLARTHNLYDEWVRTLVNLSHTLHNLGNVPGSQARLHEALEIAHQHAPHRVSRINNEIALYQLDQGKHELAIKTLMANFNQLGRLDPIAQIETVFGLGIAHTRMKNIEEATTFLLQTLHISRQVGNHVFETDTYDYLTQVYELSGDFKTANQYQKQYYENKIRSVQAAADERLESMMLDLEMQLLQQQNATLESEVTVRTRELAAALQRERRLAREVKTALATAEELSQLRSRIITTVSHEFRTPLTVINNASNLLVRHVERLTPEQRARQYEYIHNSIFYLTDLLEDAALVDTATTEGLTAEPHDLMFGELCLRLEKELLHESGHPANVVFHYEINPTPIFIDDDLLYKLALNLLTNAIKYSRPDQPIKVSIVLDFDNLLHVRICDQGIGIPVEEQDQIWELFYRCSNVETQRGLGLGLYIAKELVQALRGRITVTSEGVDNGSCFDVHIPAHHAH